MLALIHLDLPAQEALLEYRLERGKEYQLNIEIEQDSRSESFFNEEISMYNRLTMLFSVDSTDADANYYLNARYNDLHISMLAPQMDIDINSSSGRNPLLSAMLNLIESEPFRISMDRTGNLLSMDGLEEVHEGLHDFPASDTLEKKIIIQTLDEAYGRRAIQMLFDLFLSYYPEVQPIQNWTNDFNCIFNSREVPSSNRYYLGKTGEDHISIQGIGMLSNKVPFEETTTIGQVKSVVSGSQTFDYKIDRKSAWLLKCISRQRIMIETTVVSSHSLPTGLKMPSFTETYYEVTGEIVESQKTKK